MVEERSFENPEFARRVLRDASVVLGAGLAAGLLSIFVSGEWSFWPRVLAGALSFLTTTYLITFLFWKFAGVPMGNWLTWR